MISWLPCDWFWKFSKLRRSYHVWIEKLKIILIQKFASVRVLGYSRSQNTGHSDLLDPPETGIMKNFVVRSEVLNTQGSFSKFHSFSLSRKSSTRFKGALFRLNFCYLWLGFSDTMVWSSRVLKNFDFLMHAEIFTFSRKRNGEYWDGWVRDSLIDKGNFYKSFLLLFCVY